ncbi:ABC transporter permease subunit, partial [Marinilabilia sp.]|uniref:golvesin C-terminal-like domain-containing protein n=1 Tax=Marinilabilia sp. TaxID=2021252 RepID=UPI0025BD46CE
GGVFYMNFYLFTVAQVVIAAFLSADFLGRERKMDTTEVFYTRPMSNVQYVLGKTWGALMVFMGLNLVVAFLALVVTLISSDAVFYLQPMLFYLFVFSLPSLVFILGFSFILMVLIRNQAVTFVVVLGFGGMVLFYLQNTHWGVWDFIGFYLPAYYSGFSGFPEMENLLSQRIGYFLLGLFGILLTAFFLPRLPGTKNRSRVLLVLCLMVFSGAALLFYGIISNGIEGQNIRAGIRQTESLLPVLPNHRIDSCHLIVHHDGPELQFEALLTISELQKSDSLQFHINPGFIVGSVRLNNQLVDFSFSDGVLSVVKANLESTDTSLFECRVTYSGAPENETIYPYIVEEKRERLSRFDPLIGGKEHFFVQSEFVLLTREAGWYPQVAWKNFRQQPDFTNYSLQFSSANNLVVISQGTGSSSDGKTSFFSEKPLNALTLVAGNYKTDSISVDNVDYQLSVEASNNLYSSAFAQLGDTLPAVIRDLKNQYERRIGLDYPFQRLKIVEVPLHFYTYLQSWRTGTDHIQPEIILLPEYGGGAWFLDVTRTRNDFTEEAEMQGEGIDETEVQTKMFVTLTGNLFLFPRWTVFSDYEDDSRVMNEWNRIQIFPLYFYHAYQIREEGWPVFQIMMDEALRHKGQREKNDEWRSERDQYKGLLALRERSVSDWLSRENAGDTIARILNLRGIQFFSEISVQNGQDDFVKVFQHPLKRYRFRNEGPSQWMEVADGPLNLEEKYGSLVTGNQLPAFHFGDVKASTFRKEGKKQFLISVEVANNGNVDGILNTETSFLDLSENNNRSFSQWMYQNMEEDQNLIKKLYSIDANESVRIKMVFDQQPRELKIFTGVARNIPPVYSFSFANIEEQSLDINHVAGVEKYVFSDVGGAESKEYVVDNEDSEFKISSRDEVKTLKDWWLKHERKQTVGYEPFNYWRPQAVWTNSLAQSYHGDFLRSAALKASGNGNDKALWRCDLPEAGRYEVQAFIPRDLNTGWRNRNSRGRFHYQIHYANGLEKVETWPVRERNGWVSLGRFFFDKGEAVVELSDESEFPYVVADAVKWIRLK